MEKIYLTERGNPIGTMALFDMKPSVALLRACFPEAVAIQKHWHTGQWFVDLGDPIAPLLAE